MQVKEVVLKSCLSFIIVSMMGFLIGQLFPIEISDRTLQTLFFFVGVVGVPITIFIIFLLMSDSILGTLNTILKVSFASVLSIGIYYIILDMIWIAYFGRWVDYTILYQSNSNPEYQIIEQLYDAGALGYKDRRVVESYSVLGVFKYIQPINPDSIDTIDWMMVNEQVLFNEI